MTASDRADVLAQDFVTFAVEAGVLRFGEFTTKAGRASPYFFNAGLFDDDEARKAILDIRSRISQNEDQNRALTATVKQLNEQVQSLQRSLLDLNSQNEALRSDLANLRALPGMTVIVPADAAEAAAWK